jgi:pimeloyl-ACP methyl ester carboxylesterase
MAELSLVYCPKGQLTLLPEASHWLQHEEPTAVSQALNEFFAMRDFE